MLPAGAHGRDFLQPESVPAVPARAPGCSEAVAVCAGARAGLRPGYVIFSGEWFLESGPFSGEFNHSPIRQVDSPEQYRQITGARHVEGCIMVTLLHS